MSPPQGSGPDDPLPDLTRHLWAGALPDPDAPARALAERVAADAYGGALNLAWRLAGHGLAFDIDAALARWPGSIDWALVAVQMRGAAALDDLAARVARQNRRRAALARAAWALGFADRARAALEAIDPASDTAIADRAYRAELAILCGEGALPDLAALPEPARARLEMLRIATAEGPAVLKHALPRLAGDDPGLWQTGLDHLLGERDLPAATQALDRLRALVGDTPDLRASMVQLALDYGDTGRAAALLEPALAAPPWERPARTHVQAARLRLALAELGTDDPAAILPNVEAALRLFPRHETLRALWLTLRERAGDWDALERDLLALAPSPPQVWPVARALARLGRHDAALALLERAQTAAGAGDPNARARRAMAISEMRRELGDLAGAAKALTPQSDPQPDPQPDHQPDRLPAGTRIDLAVARAELAVWRFDAAGAMAALEPALALGPDRPGGWMMAARVAFLGGDNVAARASLARFNGLRDARRTAPPLPPDLRDRIVADDRPDGPAAAARALFRARPAFGRVTDGAIPRRLHHYWEGPVNGAVTRSLTRWAALHPQWTQVVHDADGARGWLADAAPDLLPAFDAQSLPAGRADVFRAGLIAVSGGVYADVDEWPRQSIDDWLDGATCVLVLECGHATVANNFIAARPGLDLFARTRAAIAEGRGDPPYPWWDSGPAVLTACLARVLPMPGLRLLTQAEYGTRVATNLPFPHKHGPQHWR